MCSRLLGYLCLGPIKRVSGNKVTGAICVAKFTYFHDSLATVVMFK